MQLFIYFKPTFLVLKYYLPTCYPRGGKTLFQPTPQGHSGLLHPMSHSTPLTRLGTGYPHEPSSVSKMVFNVLWQNKATVISCV